MKTSWLKAAPLLALNVAFWIAYAVMVGVLWVIGVPLIRWHALRGNYSIEPSKVFYNDEDFEPRYIKRWGFEWEGCPACNSESGDRLLWMNTVWGNDQEGIDGLPINHPPSVAWWPAKDFASPADRIFEWSALRNSTNNLRFMHYFVPWIGWINPKTIEPSRIRWAGTDAPLQAVLATVAPGENAVGTYYRQRFACLFVSQGLYAGLRIAVRFRGRAHQIWFGWKLNPGMAVEGWWPDDPCWKGVGFTCGQVRHSA